MHPYLHPLLEDLRDAMWAERPQTPDYRLLLPEESDAPDDMQGVLAYLHGPEYALPDLFDIAAEAFPPPEQLSEEEPTAIAGAVIALWRAWNMEPIIPAGIPANNVYPVIRDFWKEGRVQYIPDGTLHLEFCHYEQEACPWGTKYCSCKSNPPTNL